MLDKLPPGSYVIDEGSGMVLHADTLEPVSLTEEAQKIIVKQVTDHRAKELRVLQYELEHPWRLEASDD